MIPTLALNSDTLEARGLAVSVRVGEAGRAALDVLLLDAEYRQTLACMRVYARAGLSVGSVAGRTNAWWAPSFRSRWCSISAAVPDFGLDPDAYVDALLALLARYPARLVVPAHDGSIEALRRRRAELEERTALGIGSDAALEIAVDKERTLKLANELGLRTPRGVVVRDPSDVRAALREVGLPAVIKPTRSWVDTNGVGLRLSSTAVQTEEESEQRVQDLRAVGAAALIQEWIPGRREAISLFFARGRFWARFAQLSLREWPILGGVSVLCEAVPLPADITSISERLVRSIDLEGCSMVEFRRDAGGRPVLMEVNPRMGSSVALAIDAGVNLPNLLFAWKLGGQLEEVTGYRVGRRLRWLPGDIWNLKCTFDTQGQPDVVQRTSALGRFLSDFVRPGNVLDVVDVGDMRPAVAEMNKMVLRHAWKRARGWFSPHSFITEERGASDV